MDQPNEFSEEIGSTRCKSVLTRVVPNFSILEARGPSYLEFFSIITTNDSVNITALDVTDSSYERPRIYQVPKPYGWNINAQAEEMLIQVWQITGTQR